MMEKGEWRISRGAVDLNRVFGSMTRILPTTIIRVLVVFCVLTSSLLSSAQDVLVTEFMARRTNSIVDDDGNRAEFIELYNAGTSDADLGGYFLSDDCVDRFKWSFPEGVVLGPDEFLVVWATNKDRRDPCCDLHTNFRLDGEGDCLVLSDASGEQIQIYQFFPEQVLGYSYGVPMSGEQFFLVSASESCTAIVPDPDNPVAGLDWTLPTYDDSGWQTGTTGVGFDTDPDYLPLIGLDVGDAMLNNNASCYIRIPFHVEDPSEIATLEFAMKFDDGFIAYINGTRVASKHAPADPTSTSRATRFQIDSRALEFQEFDLDEGTPTLQSGQNVLAIHGLNEKDNSKDLLLLPSLHGFSPRQIERQVRNFFPTPTPGEPNAPGAPGVSATPVLSDPSGAYPPGGISVTVSMEVPVEGTVIRITLDGSLPNEGSPVYEGAIEVNSEILLTARAFQPGLTPSEPAVAHYVVLGEDVLDFSSPIPVVICSTLGVRVSSTCSSGPYTPGRFQIFTPGDDRRSHLMDDPHFSHHVGFRRRGNPGVGCGWQKFYFNVEFRNREDRDQNVEFMDFVPHSDFAMWGPYQIDRTFMRNPINYWLSREIGRWAPRTQFVECFLHTSGEPELTMKSYWGVYVLMERIKRGPGRVDIERLGSGTPDSEDPNITGGYLMQRDRTKAGDISIQAGGYSNLVFSEPDSPTDAQKAYMKQLINQAVATFHPNVSSQGDSRIFDVGSFRDHHILMWFAKNVDAYRFSSYFHKPRGGLLTAGPVWDFDRVMGAIDPRCAEPEGWNNTRAWDAGSHYFEHPGPPGDSGSMGSWFGLFFDNEPPTGDTLWARSYRDRWRELRTGPLNTLTIHLQIAAWAALLAEPAERNFERWSAKPRFGGYQGEVDHLKDWIRKRADWIDAQFEGLDLEPPRMSPLGGLVEPGTHIVISRQSGKIFYTLNGRDPLLPTSERIAYEGPIPITTNTFVRARAQIGNSWSAIVEAGFVTEKTSLVVSEIMYDPGALEGDTFDRSSYEFIELHNPSSRPTILNGVTLEVPQFEFEYEGDSRTLGPGEYLVLVGDKEAFVERYGAQGILIGGEYSGSLSDSSQGIVLRDLSDTVVMDFQYDSSWEPATNGQGRSLVIRTPDALAESWNSAASWRASHENEGSPGHEDAVLNGRVQGDLSANGRLEITDPILLVLGLFGGRAQPCESESGNLALQDVDGDGALTQNDVVRLLHYLFLEGAQPVNGLQCTAIPGCEPGC